MTSRQSGISFSGLLVWLVLIIFAAIGAMKLIPAYIQDAEIRGILQAIAREPEMQSAPIKNIRDSYGKRAMMNNISIVNENDIDIVKDSSGLKLSASYQVKVPLVANISLVFEFNPTSSAR